MRRLGDRDAVPVERSRAKHLEQVRVVDPAQAPHALEEAGGRDLARRLVGDVQDDRAVLCEVAGEQNRRAGFLALHRVDPVTGELAPGLQLSHIRDYCRMARIHPVDETSAPVASRELAAAHAATGGRMTNMKWTLAHSPVALDALLQWYPLRDAILPLLGERRLWLFCHAISTQSECLICSTFFRRLLIDAGEDPDKVELDEFDEVIVDLGRRLATDPHSVDDALHTRLAVAPCPIPRSSRWWRSGR